MSSNTDRNLYILFIGLFAMQVGLTYWNIKEQREWRKALDNQKK